MDNKVKKHKNRNTKKSRMRKLVLLVCGITFLFGLGVTGVLIWSSYQNRVYRQCVYEAGVEIYAEDFLKDDSKKIAFVEEQETIDTTIPGDYTVSLRSGFFTYECIATVQDTIAPTAEAVTIYYETGDVITAEQFVTNVTDVTETTIAFVEEPDMTIVGKQPVEIEITDAGNNKLIVSSYLITRVTVDVLTIEVGSEVPTIEEFLLSSTEGAEFVTDIQSLDLSEIGEHSIEIAANGITYMTVLQVKDTIAPVVETKDVTIYLNEEVSVESFVASALDATKLTYTFLQEPDCSVAGKQTVTVVVTDEGGNTSQAEVTLTVLEDTEAPVIHGAKDISVYLGKAISYKTGIMVTDNHDAKVSLKVDTSKVNTQKVGTYPVVYSAEDKAGNKTSVTVNVTIKANAYSLEEVNRLAQEVLSSIISDGMSQYEKLQAIYNWTRESISYTGTSDKTSWIKEAYIGLAQRKGDCFTNASVAKALLNNAGIENKDIEKIPAKTRHYWNLVNIGEGWYHFDTTPRVGQKISFCYISDADLMEYSNANNKSHNYDRNVYTNIE